MSGVVAPTPASPRRPCGPWRRPRCTARSPCATPRLLGENERLATRDSLTGLANRRLFDESLQREVARAQRLATPLSLLVLDVDHFKQVNDTYGHQTGDAVLREVSEALVANTKNYDVAARYGGDEFVVLLPGCTREDAMRVADACATASPTRWVRRR